MHTHDLSALLEKVKGVEIDEGIAKAVSDIDGYYAGARYPLDAVDPGFFKKPLAESAVKSTDEIFEWFLAKINFESE